MWKLPDFSIFVSVRFFRNFRLVKELPLAFIADFGLRKVVLRAETAFVIVEIRFFVIPVGGKSGFLISGVFLEVFFGTEKMAKT